MCDAIGVEAREMRVESGNVGEREGGGWQWPNDHRVSARVRVVWTRWTGRAKQKARSGMQGVPRRWRKSRNV